MKKICRFSPRVPLGYVVLSMAIFSLPVDATDPVTSSASGAKLDRTCFQTGRAWDPKIDLGSDVAIVYGIDPQMPDRIQSWRQHGYRINVMTGVAWGQYQDYLEGRFDGVNHEDEAQTDRDGKKIGHEGGIYYMCPGENYGKYLCVGVQRALDAGAEAIYLEEPEFWDRAGYSGGFKREWKSFYHEDWQPPESSVDAHWRSSKLKYFLYRRALGQVFDYVQDYDHRTGRDVRCYVATHSLLSYAHWKIVSPESSLTMLKGCSGYIAQVWTGTARTPVRFRGEEKSMPFEAAFLEYGAMQNLVRATGRAMWYLNDPVEDQPTFDWPDYRRSWESTLTASLFQPEVSKYEVAPWPERVFTGRYPASSDPSVGKLIPPPYATELQTVFNSLNDMQQSRIEWDCGTTGMGVLVSDSLMFERGEPTPSDPDLGNVYGLALPLLKQGFPVTPVQLENLAVPHYLDNFRVLFLTYDGQKPLTPDVHAPLVEWVKQGGVLIFCDQDADPYLHVHEWWNSNGENNATPREPLFEALGVGKSPAANRYLQVGKGGLIWMKERPADLANSPDGAARVLAVAKQAADSVKLPWRETNYLSLRRGPYLVAAGLEDSVDEKPHVVQGRFVNLFDPELQVQNEILLAPGSRFFLRDLDVDQDRETPLLASACKAVMEERTPAGIRFKVEGIADTPAIMLVKSLQAPRTVTLSGENLSTFTYSPKEGLLWIRFQNVAAPRELLISY
jgi:hypothetical protein